MSKILSKKLFGIVLILCLALGAFTGCGSNSTPAPAEPTAPAVRTITDMAGRQVTIPTEIKRIATLGSVPVVNSFVFTLGEQDKIVNGLPPFARNNPRWKYQLIFAPELKDKPMMQGDQYMPNLEELFMAAPDVIFVMEDTYLTMLEEKGLNVVFLSWREPEDVKQVITLMGDVLNKQEQAAKYCAHFDNTIKLIAEKVAAVPEKTPVLFSELSQLSQSLLIVDWWINAAGGISLTDDGRTVEGYNFTMEQLLKWDPEVLFVPNAKEYDLAFSDERFKNIRAVKNNRVYLSPIGAHTWAYRTAEQPLTVLWAATSIYPEVFKDVDLEKEVQSFYSEFYKVDLTEEQVKEILSGNPVLPQ